MPLLIVEVFHLHLDS